MSENKQLTLAELVKVLTEFNVADVAESELTVDGIQPVLNAVNELSRALDAKLSAARKAEKDAKLLKLDAELRALGITAEDLAKKFGIKVAAGRSKSKAPAKMIYRHPATGQEHSGLGKAPPKWIKEHKDAGRINEILINPPA